MEIHALLEEVDLFLGQQKGEGMEQIMLEQRITRLVINGHIPLPTTLTVAAEFLGTYNASSLPHSGTDEPCNGRNC